jgi:hypothetical protein
MQIDIFLMWRRIKIRFALSGHSMERFLIFPI